MTETIVMCSGRKTWRRSQRGERETENEREKHRTPDRCGDSPIRRSETDTDDEVHSTKEWSHTIAAFAIIPRRYAIRYIAGPKTINENAGCSGCSGCSGLAQRRARRRP